jgi:hypothetical protein
MTVCLVYRGTAPCIIAFLTFVLDGGGQFRAPATLHMRKELMDPFVRRLNWSQILLERNPPMELNITHKAHSSVTVLT